MTESKETKTIEPPEIKAEKPPKSRRGRPATTVTKERLKNAVLALTTQVGIAVSIFDSYDGKVILEGAEGLADSLADLAMVNPQVRAALLSLTEGGVYARVAMSVASIAFPILVHHGVIPNLLGISVEGNGRVSETSVG
jgi:hypothetical protein